jgi:hypothetical protein
MTVFEALALLITLRVWANESRGLSYAVRSDSAGTVHALSKLRSSNPSMNAVAAEVALDLAAHVYEPLMITHIPGVSNVIPDTLSRMFQPGTDYSLPMQLTQAIRVPAPARDRTFWLVGAL